MAGKFVDLKEAAQMLGVTPEELVEMRSKNEVFGYRDGSSWKFKMEEIERVLSERGSEIRSDSSILSANDEDFENLISGLSSKIQAEKSAEESESILVSEEELGESATGKSTIIGKGGLSQQSLEHLRALGGVYLTVVGGAASPETLQVEAIEEVIWEDLMPECLWKFRVRDFGPLFVTMDSHGNSTYQDVRDQAARNLDAAYARLGLTR